MGICNENRLWWKKSKWDEAYSEKQYSLHIYKKITIEKRTHKGMKMKIKMTHFKYNYFIQIINSYSVYVDDKAMYIKKF